MNRIKTVSRRLRFLMQFNRGVLAVIVGGTLASGPHLCAGPAQPASARNAAVPLPAGGNADSVSPAISADGRFVLFSSSANNLVPGDNSQLGLDLFLRDRASNTLTLVSANFSATGGGNGQSTAGQVSTNGHYVVFQSDASDLIAGDTNGVSDIFVRDLRAGSNILVSVASDGSWGNNASTDPVMTPDGRFVAFISAASNLVVGDTNGASDIFVRDLLNGTTTLVSVGATNATASFSPPVITPDGRYVAFSSTAKGLVAGVPTASLGGVYVRDLASNTTTWASSNAAAEVASVLHLNNAPSYHPAISDDGSFISFKTGWTNGATATGSTGTAATMVFQSNLTNATLTSISSNGFATWVQNDDVCGPEMSPDGRFVVFVATNSGGVSVQLWDAQAGTNLLVSAATDGSYPTDSVSDTPAVSPDGHYIVFLSNATNLVTNIISSGVHIYRRDVQAGVTALVDADTNGIGSINPVLTQPTMSADGRFVTFASADDGLVGGFKNGPLDAFVADVNNSTTELISARSPGLIPQTGNGWSFLGLSALSDDGRKIVFSSAADDVVPNDANGSLDVFLYDVASGTNALVSAGVDGNPAGGSSCSPALALGGQLVAFVSTATNLVAGQTNFFANVFLRDMLAGTNSLISVATNGVWPGNGDAMMPAISQDGRYVVFVSRASNLATNAPAINANAYLRDRTAGTTILLANNAPTNLPPTISDDGRYVAYFSLFYNYPYGYNQAYLYVHDTQLGTNIFATNFAGAAAISPSGARLLWLHNTAKSLSVINLLNQSNLFTLTAGSPMKFSAPWSADGRFFAFVTATNADPTDNNGTNDVYLCDLSSNTLTLVSVNADHTGAGNDASDAPAISGDGRFVIFRSFATNLVAGTLNPPNVFLYDRFTSFNSLLTTAAPGSAWYSWTAQPAINGDGSAMAYQSWNPVLVAGDLNRVEDVFYSALSPWGTADSDNDGIPDEWMIYYFGHPTGLASDHSRAQDDADGNGMSNLEKYLAGLDPTNPASNLQLQIAAQISSSQSVTLNWPAVPGKNYRVQFKNNLNDAAWSDLTGAAVLGLQGVFAVPVDGPNRYYRVMAQ
jgi:Tol biopolymer transport system component